MIGLPYVALDGINEDGFAIGVLALNEAPTMQNDATKTNITTTVAIRMLLDRASTVKQAIEMLKQYNMRMFNTDNEHNYHFFMADATGDYAIVEYTRNTNNSAETNPTRMEVFTGNDTLRCVTNFYVSSTMVGTTDGWGSEHGKQRYFDMRTTLSNSNYNLNSTEAMSLLSLVSQQPNEADPTSFTQWSALYNLTDKSIRLALLREYGKIYNFKVK
ncbi:MAG: linear amide C-N hydrolase [Bacteroidota bacterium]|nr:linear amide C-N hydrolase [Bacteroidota bacterium]